MAYLFRSITVCALLAALSFAGGAATRAGEWEARDEIVATVNGDPITNAELTEQIYYTAQKEGVVRPDKPGFTDEEKSVLARDAVRTLIRARLIRQEAKRLGVGVSEETITQYLEERRMDTDEIARRMAESNLLLDDILQKEGIPIHRPAPRQIRSFYTEHQEMFSIPRQVRAREILVPKTSAETIEMDRNRAGRIHDELQKPRARFADVAATYGHNEGERRRGGLILLPGTEGDNAFFDPTNKTASYFLPPPVLDALATLARGRVSPVVESDLGFHILYVEEERPPQIINYREAEPQIENHLVYQSRVNQQRRWLVRVMRDSRLFWSNGDAITVEQIMPPMPTFELRRTGGE